MQRDFFLFQLNSLGTVQILVLFRTFSKSHIALGNGNKLRKEEFIFYLLQLREKYGKKWLSSQGKKLRKEEFIFWFAPATWKLREKITYLPGKKLRRNILPGNFSQGRKFPGKNTPRELIPGEKNPCTPVRNSLRTQYAGNSRRFYFNEHVARYLKLRTLGWTPERFSLFLSTLLSRYR